MLFLRVVAAASSELVEGWSGWVSWRF